MLNRRHVLGALVLTATLAFGSASAMDKQPFDQKAFEAAQAAGKPILVEVNAPWCPVCRAQAPPGKAQKRREVQEPRQLQRRLRFAEGPVEEVQRAEAEHAHRVQGQEEAGRSTGDTNAASIEALIAKSI